MEVVIMAIRMVAVVTDIHILAQVMVTHMGLVNIHIHTTVDISIRIVSFCHLEWGFSGVTIRSFLLYVVI
jgi:uncharacterized membrane protein